MDWRSAHRFCRGQGGFLIGPEEMTRPEVTQLTPDNVTWTALGPHAGHLQWLTRRPALGQFLQWSGGKEGRGEGCASLHLPSLLLHPRPCSSLFPSVCFVSPGEELHAGVDVRLRVEVDVDGGGGGGGGGEVVKVKVEDEEEKMWVEVLEEAFYLLSLTCAAHLSFPGASAPSQPQVFWSKEGVYLPFDATTLLPAIVHDPTKSHVTTAATHLLLQGTYWCETWPRNAPEPLASNKVLLTLQGREVLLLHLQSSRQSPPLTPRTLEARLKQVFAVTLPGFEDFPVDVVSIMEDETGSENLVSSRVQIHLPAASAAFSVLLEMLRAGRSVEDLLERAGFLSSSAAGLPTRCRNRTDALFGGNSVQWPFTEAGPVQPLHYRCEAKHGRLLQASCRWNYTHGAAVHFDPRRCQRFDFCPRGYTGLAGNFCVSLTPASTWDEGFQAAHVSCSAMSLLDTAKLHEAEAGAPSLYQEVRRWLAGRVGGGRLWLPARRLAPFGPLVFVGPQESEYPITLYKGSPSFNVSWAAGQPSAGQDCLALDTTGSHLLSLPCGDALPFLSVLDVSKPFAVARHGRGDAAPPLPTTNPLCAGWEATGYPGAADTCFTVFSNGTGWGWDEAADLCAGQDAHLPDPSRGFSDWPLRQYLYSRGIPSVWIRLPDPHLLGEAGERCGTFLNWRADADPSLPHAALTPSGWVGEGRGAAKKHVLCQTHVQSPTVALQVFEEAGHVRLAVHPPDAAAMGSARCYVNGRRVPVRDKLPVMAVDDTTQGYYECRAWAAVPLRLATSNTLLHTHRGALTFSVTLARHTKYTPSQHDATFTPVLADPCVDAFLERVRQGLPDGVRVVADNHYFTSEPKTDQLLIHFHVRINSTEATNRLTESEAAERVDAAVERLSEPQCRPVSASSTVGCFNETQMDQNYGEMTLTWPATRGAAVLLPSQLCVTEEGEPVTRQCLGDFTRGYRWGKKSGECTDKPHNVTRLLWEINQVSSSSDPASLATLTARGHSLTAADVHFVAQKMQSISREAPVTQQNLEDIVETLNNVMAADGEVFGKVQRVLNTSSILLDAFENIILRVQLPRAGGDQAVRSDRRLVSVERVDVMPNSSIIGYQTWRKNKDQDEDELLEEEVVVRKGTKINWRRSKVTLVLPDNLTQQMANETVLRDDPKGARDRKVELTFAVYRNAKLFQDSKTFPKHTVDGHIVQARYGRHSVANLQQPVKIYFRIGRDGSDPKCVFWDFQRNEGRGGWSTVGCRSGGRHGDHLLCLCDHLTCFARLVIFDGEGAGGVHEVVLDTISLVGCSLSILSLLLLLATFLLFQKWRRRLSNKILANLAAAVLCSLVVFLAGIQQTLFPVLCRGVAVALHYFILASFGWMLVEAVHQYLKFVKVVGTYIPRFIWKASVCAWGAPFVPIIAVLVYDSTLYDSDQRPEDKICWMSSAAFKYAFLPPLALTMAANLVLFLLIIHSATCGRVRVTSTLSERQLRLTQLRMAVSVFFLLGFTWVFGLLTFWQPNLVFSYLFCVSNTLQGFFIFLFHVFRERDARRLWRDFLSVITRDSSASSEPRSRSLPSPQYSGQPSRGLDSHCAAYYQQGEVCFNPHGADWDVARGSVRSARTASTLTHSRASTPP